MARYQWTKEDAAAVVQQARSMGVDPVSLTALMELESNGDPNIMGGAGGKFRGAIQFSEDAAKEVGLPGGPMTLAQQVPYIGKYFQQRGFKPGEHGVTEMYRTVLVGNPRQSGTDSFGTNSDKAAKRMKPGGDLYERARRRLSGALGGELPSFSAGASTSASPPAATQLAGDSLVGAMAQDPGAAAVVNQVATTGFNPFAIGAAALAPAANSEQTRFAGAAIEAIFGGGKKGGSIETGDLVTGLPQEALPSVAAAAGANEQRPSGAGGTLGLVPLGKQLQALGFKVAEHPEFGGVGKHSPRSHHYAGNALDITIQPGSPLLKGRPDSDWLAVKKQWGEKLRQALPGAEIFHPGYDPVGGHGSHIHLALPGGSTVVTEQLQRLLALTQG